MDIILYDIRCRTVFHEVSLHFNILVILNILVIHLSVVIKIMSIRKALHNIQT